MTPQQERKTQAVQFHNKADAIKIGMVWMLRRILKRNLKPSPYAKFCRRMARNNERAHRRNAS